MEEKTLDIMCHVAGPHSGALGTTLAEKALSLPLLQRLSLSVMAALESGLCSLTLGV